jgi:hypothetical protein
MRAPAPFPTRERSLCIAEAVTADHASCLLN